MGIAYRCDAASGCTYVVWDVEVTPDEWRSHFEAMSNDPAFPPGPRMLADLSTAGGAPGMSTDIVTEMATAWSERVARTGPMKLAIVPNGAWEKARQLERAIGDSGLTAIVFNDLVTACTWLGLQPALVGPIIEGLRAELPPIAAPD